MTITDMGFGSRVERQRQYRGRWELECSHVHIPHNVLCFGLLASGLYQLAERKDGRE
jgi:hypothetical protein